LKRYDDEVCGFKDVDERVGQDDPLVEDQDRESQRRRGTGGGLLTRTGEQGVAIAPVGEALAVIETDGNS
jgi:hypothetical protein